MIKPTTFGNPEEYPSLIYLAEMINKCGKKTIQKICTFVDKKIIVINDFKKSKYESVFFKLRIYDFLCESIKEDINNLNMVSLMIKSHLSSFLIGRLRTIMYHDAEKTSENDYEYKTGTFIILHKNTPKTYKNIIHHDMVFEQDNNGMVNTVLKNRFGKTGKIK